MKLLFLYLYFVVFVFVFFAFVLSYQTYSEGGNNYSRDIRIVQEWEIPRIESGLAGKHHKSFLYRTFYKIQRNTRIIFMSEYRDHFYIGIQGSFLYRWLFYKIQRRIWTARESFPCKTSKFLGWVIFSKRCEVRILFCKSSSLLSYILWGIAQEAGICGRPRE